MTYQIEEHTQNLEAAERSYRADLAALKDGDGRQLYNDDEHNQRVGNAYVAYQRAIREAGEAGAAEAAAARSELERLDVEREAADPLDALADADIARASARAPFLREDFATLPAAVLAHRAEAALAGHDRVQQTLVLRYGARRLARLEADRGIARNAESGEYGLTGTARDADEDRLAAAVERLRAKFADPGLAGRRAESERRAEAAAGLTSMAALAEHRLRTSGARPRAGIYTATGDRP